jgi:hypothetical protein
VEKNPGLVVTATAQLPGLGGGRYRVRGAEAPRALRLGGGQTLNSHRNRSPQPPKSASFRTNPYAFRLWVPGRLVGGSSVTVIDGATNATTTVGAGSAPFSVAVNPVTNKIYVANFLSNNVPLLAEEQVQTIPLTTTISPLPGNRTSSITPTFTFAASSAFSPSAPPPDAVRLFRQPTGYYLTSDVYV